MGALTSITELMSLIFAGLVLAVSFMLLGVWGMSFMLASRWRSLLFAIGGILLLMNGCYGIVTWILLVVKHDEIRDPLDSVGGNILGRERIIAAGFTCWVVVLILQVLILLPCLI